LNIKLKDKQALQRFRELCERITEATSAIPANESKEAKKERIKKLLGNYADFVSFYFPHYAQAPCGDFHIKAANKVLKNRKLRAVFEWARGHAKSTHFNILIPLWLKAQGELKVMVLVGKNEKNAVTLLSDLQAELESNKLYSNDFGEQLRYGNWEEGRFVTQDDCAFFALGRGQSPRGLRHRQHRPDYIIMDDIDDDELCRNPDRVRKAADWANEALFFTTDMGRGRFILVGNRISNTSVLAALAENKTSWHHKVNVLDNAGNPSWYQKYSKNEVDELIASMGYRASQKELFNNPIVEGAVFKNEWISYSPVPRLQELDEIISYCDPSFKSSATSDCKAIVTVGRKGKDIYVLDAFVRQCSVSEMVRWWYNHHEGFPSTVICNYFMEANFIQDLIFEEFVNEGLVRGYQLPLRPDKRAKPDKFARIEAISPLFERGFIKLNEKHRSSRDMKELQEQLLSFEKGSRSHDDGPDALEGAIFLINKSSRKEGKAIFGTRENRRF
jgi:predicted phage terminase large subunit-like protein